MSITPFSSESLNEVIQSLRRRISEIEVRL